MSHFECIAIVGRGCVLPGALDPAALFRLVMEKGVAVGPVPSDRWRLGSTRALAQSSSETRDRSISDRGGYVRGFDERFDPSGFAVDGVASLDPIFRWTLHAAREALREAGLYGSERCGGAILGNLSFPSATHARFVEAHWLARADSIDPRERFHSGLLAPLVSRALGVVGAPSFCLDAACASSLYAIALACQTLADRRADVMLAGAVNCTDDLFIHIGFTALGALSASGQSRPFHPHADGLVPAEGAAVLALMRLSDALREGRRVLGVIRGVGLANDGRARSFLAPAEDGQLRAMRAAYAQAELSPSEIGYLECHATGTRLGDETEMKSSARVFAEHERLAIGSLKANLGHLITTAGAAGLLKVLGAFEAGLKPPTPVESAEVPSPLCVLREAEPWEGKRIAAVSAFGFGGNDAHLLVEELDSRPSARRTVQPSREKIAIVGIGARVGSLASAQAFADALSRGSGGRRCSEIVLPREALRSPPADLSAALAQQTLLLSAALDVSLEGIDTERTGIFIGMQCDSEVARYGVRWRLSELTDEAADPDAFAPPLSAAGVLGTMPNIPANRLNVQLDVRGPSHTVSADELSGVRALEIAVRALATRELDAALVGAVDLACEPVHERAARELLPDALRRGGDAAIVLLLVRLEDAREKRVPILAIFDAPDENAPLRFDRGTLASRFGHAHAASGLLHVAAAALSLHRRARLGERAGKWAHEGVRRALVDIESLGGERAQIGLSEDPQTRIGACALASALPTQPLTLAAHPATPFRTLRTSDGETLEAAPELAPAPFERLTVAEPGPSDGWLEPAPALDIAPPSTPITQSQPVAVQRAVAASHGVEQALVAEVLAQHERIAALHADFVRTQTELHQRFLDARSTALRQLSSVSAATAAHVAGDATPSREKPAPSNDHAAPEHTLSRVREWAGVRDDQEAAPERFRERESAETKGGDTAPHNELSTHASRGLVAHTPPPAPVGRRFTREELEVHASGCISEIFGARFAAQDAFAVQVRMPEPPLLLADRVTGLSGDPGTMGKGTVWTETDVARDAWYLQNGRMPAGVMIESGQADLFLISWLGADLVNRGERAYRLLGCKLTWHRSPPRIGETLSYDIHVDGHASQGDVRLFFFHYDCHIDGEPALTVRSGQAGFFTAGELAASAGVLWSPEEEAIDRATRLDPPRVVCERHSFDEVAITALCAGDVASCFGRGYERTRAHVRTPAIAGGTMRFFERVTHFDPRGGPHGRGYLRAVTTIRPDAWYFDGHFKNDPCMPGTLMLEGCLSAMAFYLIGLGFSLDRDGWRFEPIPHETYDMICRGQVIPSSKELAYELFVHEIHDGPIPKLYADLLCQVDGLKAFHARRLGIQLVPDWPLTRHPELLDGSDPEPVAVLDGVPLGHAALLASAWGRPSTAFGPRYACFDGVRRAARLPGPPYHMVSRVTRIEGEPWKKSAGASVEMAYDVPSNAWYFADGASGSMPYSLLLEAALQPCGWLATYVGCTLGREGDLRFRNLDGEGEVLCEVAPDAGTLRTRASLRSISDTASMVIVGFDVVSSLDQRDVYRLRTTFGFFPDAAFEAQAGLPIGEAHRALFDAVGEPIDLRSSPSRFFGGSACLPTGRLSLLDEVSFFDGAGRSQLGAARAKSTVDSGAWFFRAHFFQDPVQPGSLGMEAMLALLRFCMLEKKLDEGMHRPRFSPIATRPHRWKYRGQVLPEDAEIVITLELTSIERGADHIIAESEASFWVDGKRIYEATIALALNDVREA